MDNDILKETLGYDPETGKDIEEEAERSRLKEVDTLSEFRDKLQTRNPTTFEDTVRLYEDQVSQIQANKTAEETDYSVKAIPEDSLIVLTGGLGASPDNIFYNRAYYWSLPKKSARKWPNVDALLQIKRYNIAEDSVSRVVINSELARAVDPGSSGNQKLEFSFTSEDRALYVEAEMEGGHLEMKWYNGELKDVVLYRVGPTSSRTSRRTEGWLHLEEFLKKGYIP